MVFFFFFKQKTAYEMRISDWSSDVCSSDLIVVQGVDIAGDGVKRLAGFLLVTEAVDLVLQVGQQAQCLGVVRTLADKQFQRVDGAFRRSEERRVGKGGVSRGRTRGGPYHYKKKLCK